MKKIKLWFGAAFVIAYLSLTVVAAPIWLVPMGIWLVIGFLCAAFFIFQPIRAFGKVFDAWAWPMNWVLKRSGLGDVLEAWSKKHGPSIKKKADAWKEKAEQDYRDSQG